jgi:hypothetical protein
MRQEAASVTRCITEGAGLPVEDLARLTREILALRGNLEGAAAKAEAA